MVEQDAHELLNIVLLEFLAVVPAERVSQGARRHSGKARSSAFESEEDSLQGVDDPGLLCNAQHVGQGGQFSSPARTDAGRSARGFCMRPVRVWTISSRREPARKGRERRGRLKSDGRVVDARAKEARVKEALE